MIENILVYSLVLACAAYAVIKLAPRSLKQQLASAILKLDLPSGLRMKLEKFTLQKSGLGCDGCSNDKPSTSKKSAKGQPVTFFRNNTRKNNESI